MEPILRTLILRGFRSFRSEAIHFDNPTLLVGLNGSGKSNIRDAIDFLSEAMESALYIPIHKRGWIEGMAHRPLRKARKTGVCFGLKFGAIADSTRRASYAIQIKFGYPVNSKRAFGLLVAREQCVVHRDDGTTDWFDHRGERFDTNAVGLAPMADGTSLVLPLVAGDLRFRPVWRAISDMRGYSIEPSSFRHPRVRDNEQMLRPDGGNAAEILDDLIETSPDSAQRIGELLASVAPGIAGVGVRRRGRELVLSFDQEPNPGRHLRLDSTSISDGTLRALGLLLAIYQDSKPSVLVIEEPEATIHFAAIETIAGLLRHASKTMQVVATTHSPDLLDADWVTEENIRVVTSEGGESKVRPLARGAKEAIQEHLMTPGELLRANALWESTDAADHPHAPLFRKVRS